jgi:glycosyltransferase involved in cell wall biosynthesis
VRLVWAGSGSLLEQYRAEVRTRGLEGRVAFVGHVDDTDALYRRALVYVQPSRVESLGLALLDAIRHAVPSVVPAVGGMPEVVLDGRTGSVVAPGRPDLLAEAVARLLTDPAERTARGSAARAYYAEEFSEERWDERMAALHREVLGE